MTMFRAQSSLLVPRRDWDGHNRATARLLLLTRTGDDRIIYHDQCYLAPDVALRFDPVLSIPYWGTGPVRQLVEVIRSKG